MSESFIVPGRRTGKTTKAIQACPPNAIYVCPTRASIDYSRNIALGLGRGDIRFVGPEFIRDFRHKGLRNRIEVDHAVEWRALPGEAWHDIDIHNQRTES